MSTDTSKPAGQRTLTDPDKAAIKAAFDALRASPGFKARASQNRMMAAVSRALGTSKGGAVIEAPTGVGKSLGYLTAGVPIALAHKRPLVIGTGTVALQEQLVNRDIPRFLKATGLEATVALAKGRGRYACVRNLTEAAFGQGDLDLDLDFGPVAAKAPTKEESALVNQLATQFNGGTWNGDLDTVTVPLPDPVRKRITTTSGGCNRSQCNYASQCPYLLARKATKQAQIVVANHDYILASLQVPVGEDGEHPLLPNPERSLYAFDEAHNLPEKAIEASASRLHLATHLQVLERGRATVSAAFAMAGVLDAGGLKPTDAQRVVGDAIESVREMAAMLQAGWTPDPQDREPTWRAPGGQLPEAWRDLALRVFGAEAQVVAALSELRDKIKDAEGKTDAKDKLARTLGRLLESLEDALGLWKAWSRSEGRGEAPTARWITAGRDGSLVCHASPVSAAQALQFVWDQVDSVVLCSATLSLGGNFDHFFEQAAVPEHWEAASLPTPFNLAENAVLSVPKMKALPQDADAHTAEVATWIEENLDWGAGNLVLFTSRRQMEQVVQRIPQERVLKVLVQGSRSRTELLDAHAQRIKAGTGSTIFGLAGFGEGVDLAGELATTVVIAKLPFATPSDPVGATKAEWYEARGRSAFFEIAIPDVQRVLTQFMGRLIRTETDTGRIVLLDRRVVVKRYGQDLLDSLPPYRRAIA